MAQNGYGWAPPPTRGWTRERWLHPENTNGSPAHASGAESLYRGLGVWAEQMARQDAFEQADVGMRLTE